MTTEYIYHLTATELRDLMTLAIAKWEALDRDVTAAVEAALEADDAKRLENSLPLVDEELFCQCGHEERWHDNEDSHCDKCDCDLFQETLFPDIIPFRGEPIPYNDDDNISPTAIGLEPVA